MLLAVDIGNTSISVAFLNGRRIIPGGNMDVHATHQIIGRQLRSIIHSFGEHKAVLKEAIICSVVPEKNIFIARLIKNECKISAKIVGKDLIVPIVNRYHQPTQVGQDRLVVTYAVKVLYGQPAIVIDLGTAITFDVVSAKGDYAGGMIVPGIRLSLESLYAKTALLPKVELVTSPKTLIGKNTKESILSGIFYGYGEMCSGLIVKISKQLKSKPQIVITGGYADVMKRFISVEDMKMDRWLVFKGIALLYRHYHSA